MANKKILLAPLDPVHDVGLKFIKRKLDERGYHTILLPPDVSVSEITDAALLHSPDIILVSRTVGYGTEQIFRRLLTSLEQKGIRQKVKIAIGGMAVTEEMATNLGFDAGFTPKSDFASLIAFIEGEASVVELVKKVRKVKPKPDIIAGYSYQIKDEEVAELLNKIVEKTVNWAKNKTSPGIERAKITESQLAELNGSVEAYTSMPYTQKYLSLSDNSIVDFFRHGALPPHTRQITQEEIKKVRELINQVKERLEVKPIQHNRSRPLVFIQYGTGCPIMDVMHIKASEAFGTDGVIHFDPAWGARTEGLTDGYLANLGDGTPITYANLSLIKESLETSTLWSVRAHRGLNTPETVVLAGWLKADLTKINIPYGALGGGTDPERMTVDGIETLKLAAKYNLPFDIPTNEELCGVPAYKAFASMLIMASLGLYFSAKPILKPLICYSPAVIIEGKMEDNYIEYNAAKILALRWIADIPIWAGEPIGFMTHKDEKIQSASTTAFHANLLTQLNVDAITIASTDEVFAKGPITASAHIATLKSVAESFRFTGSTSTFQPTEQTKIYAEELIDNIRRTLRKVAECSSLVEALYKGILGSPEDGAYPGKAGKNTIITSSTL